MRICGGQRPSCPPPRQRRRRARACPWCLGRDEVVTGAAGSSFDRSRVVSLAHARGLVVVDDACLDPVWPYSRGYVPHTRAQPYARIPSVLCASKDSGAGEKKA